MEIGPRGADIALIKIIDHSINRLARSALWMGASGHKFIELMTPTQID